MRTEDISIKTRVVRLRALITDGISLGYNNSLITSWINQLKGCEQVLSIEKEKRTAYNQTLKLIQ